MLDERPARAQMLLTYLRLAGRTDAASCFAAAVRDDAFFVRWPAMREWLALDAPTALPHLRIMAQADPHAEFRTVARATLAMIGRQEAAICHA
jgi:HEAT repeat protein